MVAEPVLPALHKTLVTAVDELTAVAGWVMLTELIVVHPFASVTVTVFTPAVCPVITDVVATVDHK